MRRSAKETPWKPTREQLAAAVNGSVPDLIVPNLKVLFCGINPGLYSAATRHHFARPGNRFWPALFAAGFTPRLLSPFDERELLPLGYGITNVLNRATATADELDADEFVNGGRRLVAKVVRNRPRILAVLGVGAFRVAFAHNTAAPGPQVQRIDRTRLWVLPNPSGLNAHYQADALAGLFRQLKRAAI